MFDRWIVVAALAMCGLASPAAAQADLETRAATLRARLAAAPRDTAAGCELGFVYVRLGRPTEAIAQLDPSIAALGEPQSPALSRRLAMCLYTRGRAAEAVDDRPGAVAAYQRSLALRPSDETAYRLSIASLPARHGLGLATPAERAALALLPAGALPSDVDLQTLVTHEGAAGTAFHLVDVASTALVVVACASVCVAGYVFDLDPGVTFSLQRSEVRTIGSRSALALWIHATRAYEGEDEDGDTHSYEADGDELHVRWLGSEGRLHGFGLQVALDTETTSFAIGVELRSDGTLSVRRRSGRAPDDVRALFGAARALESLDCAGQDAQHRCHIGGV